ncbi:MAG: beta-propeller domain-containing protein [Planctomycetota bacterium]|nr:beta-propeller domain-containing protein [Planctomycetota bacterium]
MPHRRIVVPSRRPRRDPLAARPVFFEPLEPRIFLSGGSLSDTPSPGGTEGDSAAYALRPVGSQEVLRDWLIQAGVEENRGLFGQTAYPYWWYKGGWETMGWGMVAATNTGGPSYSTTNVQEAGIDEGDLVETDGRYIYSLTGGGLTIVDAWPASQLHVEVRTPIQGQAVAMYLYNDRLTVLSQIGGNRFVNGGVGLPFSIPIFDLGSPWGLIDFQGLKNTVSDSGSSWGLTASQGLKVTVFDIADRAAPVVVQETVLDGQLVESRAIDDRVFVVMENNKMPDLLILTGEDGVQRYETQSAYEARLRAADIETLLPFYSTMVNGPAGEQEIHGSLIDLGNTWLPDGADGTDLLTVAAFDVDNGLAGPVSATTVAGSGGEIYMSAESLYVVSQAHTDWRGGWWSEPTSAIYKFDLRADGVPLVATGTVRGAIVNQFSMDEQGGYFRIATTERMENPPPGWPQQGLSNNLFVLKQRGDRLEIVGSLTGLAQDERIYSIRFMGDRGYVVTFKTVDPLFVLDLSDPEKPKVAGELKMPGFSTYLHPIDADHVIGFGRDADPVNGRFIGLQLALFDVSDAANPVAVDRQTLPPGARSDGSEALTDHHAFSYFADQGILALPIGAEWYGQAALRVYQVDAAKGFTFLGEITHPTAVRRSLQIGGWLYSVSSSAVKVNQMDKPSHEVASISLAGSLSTPLRRFEVRVAGGSAATAATATVLPGMAFLGSPTLGAEVQWMSAQAAAGHAPLVARAAGSEAGRRAGGDVLAEESGEAGQRVKRASAARAAPVLRISTVQRSA